MGLPKRPPLSDPIPNGSIPNTPEQYIVKAPYWNAVVEGDLAVNAQGELTLSTGAGSGDPNTQIQAAWWSMGLGAGLSINEDGELVPGSSPYTYCTPAYPSLEPSSPPYGCDTEVNTAGVTDFTEAWYNCGLEELPCFDASSGETFTYAFYGNSFATFPTINTGNGTYFAFAWGDNSNLTEFPVIDISKGENFEGAWFNCTSLTTFPLLDFSNATILGDSDNFNYGAWENCESLISFPPIDTSNVTKFTYTWDECVSLTSFPLIDTSNGEEFRSTWHYCTSLTTFPALDFSSGIDFTNAWENCSSLTIFLAGMFDNCASTTFNGAWLNCALSQQSVDNILVSLDTAGQSNGVVNIDGGTSSAPGTAGLAAKASLEGKGWTVTTN